MTATTTTAKEAAGLPDGLHASEGVLYLARASGFTGAKLPATVILQRGFSEPTGFFRDSKGRRTSKGTFGGWRRRPWRPWSGRGWKR